MEVLAAVDTPRQGDFGGMKVLLGHKRGNIQRSGAGLESGGKTALGRSNGQTFAEKGHSFSILTDKRSKASSKTIPPYSAI